MNEIERLRDRVKDLEAALYPLVRIAFAYDDNALDDEAQKFWGMNDEHENKDDPARIELYSGRGGTQLLTLADCLKARELIVTGRRWGMSDIVDGLREIGDDSERAPLRYEKDKRTAREAVVEIERLRSRVAELEETVRFSEDQRRMLFDAAKKLEAECDRLQSLANVYRTEVTASRNERAVFFSRTMNYEQWQSASRQVEIARADTDAARVSNGEVE